MLISTLRLEAKALKAFREEPESDSDFEDELDGDDQGQREGGAREIELGTLSGRSSDDK
jgi:hypothetical protein